MGIHNFSGGEADVFGGEASSPPPHVDETLVDLYIKTTVILLLNTHDHSTKSVPLIYTKYQSLVHKHGSIYIYTCVFNIDKICVRFSFTIIMHCHHSCFSTVKL